MRPIAVTACLLALATAGAAGALAVTDRGTGGDDRLVGGAGGDELRGRGGADLLIGAPRRGRADRRGMDPTACGADPDATASTCATGSSSRRPATTGSRPATDGSDEISCGAGDDVAIVDAVEEGVYDCERVSEPS